MKISQLTHPLAIAMWDYTWLERHYRYGSFEDWDKVIDELVERGYNAVRIDVFPQLIAADRNGSIAEKSQFASNGFHTLWGNEYHIEFNVRKELVTFIKKLEQRGIYIGLSNWMLELCSKKGRKVKGLEDFVRIWDETLQFLKDNDCLDNVIYVDLLNEYPQWHGFEWLTNQIKKRMIFGPPLPGESYNKVQQKFYRDFIDSSIRRLKEKWNDLDFFASATENFWGNNESKNDYSNYDLLDVHLWIVHNKRMGMNTGYQREISPMKTDKNWVEVSEKMYELWSGEKEYFINWADEKMALAESAAKKYNIPLGNTEGWGAIFWDDHPYMNWDFIKESGLVCAELAVTHNYAFICSCNFCHPHFRGIWDDIEWHQKVTSIIKNADIAPCR